MLPPLRGLEVAVLDIETTGLFPRRNDRSVEIAVLRGRVGEEPSRVYTTLVNPKRDIGPTRIHGVRTQDRTARGGARRTGHQAPVECLRRAGRSAEHPGARGPRLRGIFLPADQIGAPCAYGQDASARSGRAARGAAIISRRISPPPGPGRHRDADARAGAVFRAARSRTASSRKRRRTACSSWPKRRASRGMRSPPRIAHTSRRWRARHFETRE